MNDETILWKGTSSQVTNFWIFGACLLVAAGAVVGGLFFPPAFALLALPVGFALWEMVVVKMRVYELTSQRLRLYTGVLNRRIDEIELYRVKDTVVEQPFWMRLFGLGTLVLQTSDRSHPSVKIPAIGDVLEVRELVRTHVEQLRDRKRVREVDFEGSDDGLEGDWE